ncbi:MAG: GNAT family N-acetyltransferase [Acidimicrobiales bacterium]|jgi:acyl-CoA synthetase (NDP forming)/GNAT superfamily N-acetyltransferase
MSPDDAPATAGGQGPGGPGPGGPGPYPSELECDVLLSDGRTAHLRPIRADDGPALRSFGEKLSTETVYFRFFSPRKRIGDEEIAHYVTVDYQDRLALVAVVEGELVAVARYDRCAREAPGAPVAASPGTPPGTGAEEEDAEVAFVVRDDHQGRGLGTVLLEHLASAAVQRGIGRFVADALPENYRMLNVFRSAGFDEHALLDSGVIRVTMELASRPEYLARVEGREWTAAVRSIEHILRPSSIAVIGQSHERGSVGHDIVRNLLAGGFTGAVYPVDRQAGSVCGLRAYPSLGEIPGPIDLAVVALPRELLDDVVRGCGAKGVGGIVVVAWGGPAQGAHGDRSTSDLVELARNFGMRLVGPDCMGVMNTCPEVRMNASVAEHPPPPGRVAFSCQSGGLGVALLGELASRGLGISSFVSLGDKADVSGNDLLQFWADDPQTDVILLYLESFGNPRKFNRIARRVARKAPIVAVKSARTASGRRGAHGMSAVAVPDQATDALFRQAGVIRVGTLEELLDVAELLASQPLPAGRRVAIVGNAGGCGVLTADACESYGLEVPELSHATQERLLGVVSDGAAIGNPIDLAASATAEEYRLVLEMVLGDDDLDVVVVTFTSPFLIGADEVAQAVAGVASTTTKPVLANFTPTEGTLSALRAGPKRVPWFAYPESAAFAMARVAPYAEWVKRPEGTVPRFDDLDVLRAREIVERALAAGPVSATGPSPVIRSGASGAPSASAVWLDTLSAFELLKAYGIPILPCLRASDAAQAVEGARALGYPVALKLDAPALVHKSDVGGVRLNLGSPEDVASAAEALLGRFGAGVSLVVQPMGPDGVETVVGVVEDPSFGPLVMFGLGGKEAELFRDQIWSLVPMTTEDARDLVSGLRSSALLTGYRGSAMVDLGALGEVLLRVARLAEDLPEVAELSLNPVVASPAGAMALDARVRVAAALHEPPLLRRTMRTA